MRILVIDNGTSFLKELKETLKNFEYEIINFRNFKEKYAEKFTHIILTGGNEKMDFDLFSEEKKLIENSNKPILGICFGHQFIAKIFGSEIFKLDFKREGYFEANLLEKDMLLTDLEKKIIVYQSNSYSVRNLGENLIVLGESKSGKEILRHKNRKLYGVQFHPEVGSKDGRKIIENFLKIF